MSDNFGDKTIETLKHHNDYIVAAVVENSVQKNTYKLKKTKMTQILFSEKKSAYNSFVAIETMFNSTNLSGDSKNSGTSTTAKANTLDWFIDSGASSHMTNETDFFTNEIKSNSYGNIKIANNEPLDITSKGDLHLQLKNWNVTVYNVLCVPKLTANLLSVSKIVETGNRVIFDHNGCTIFNRQCDVIVNTKPNQGVYKITMSLDSLHSRSSDADMLKWHRRLGHINPEILKKMKNRVKGLVFENDDDAEIKNCTTCSEEKQHHEPFQYSRCESKEVLQLIHTDFVGPMKTISLEGARFSLTFVDDYSKKVFVYFLKAKSQALSTFKEFQVMIESQTGTKIRTIRSDKGGEYVNTRFKNHCIQQGILHQRTCAFTPERMNFALAEKAKCFLLDSKLSKNMWVEATRMAEYVCNRTLNSSHDGIPNELFYNVKVDLTNLKLFGCRVMVLSPKANRNRTKWDENSTQMTFIGYCELPEGYRCYDRKTQKIIVSRDVIFREDCFGNVADEVYDDISFRCLCDDEKVSGNEDNDEVAIDKNRDDSHGVKDSEKSKSLSPSNPQSALSSF